MGKYRKGREGKPCAIFALVVDVKTDPANPTEAVFVDGQEDVGHYR